MIYLRLSPRWDDTRGHSRRSVDLCGAGVNLRRPLPDFLRRRLQPGPLLKPESSPRIEKGGLKGRLQAGLANSA
jgi:hypothetical protein